MWDVIEEVAEKVRRAEWTWRGDGGEEGSLDEMELTGSVAATGDGHLALLRSEELRDELEANTNRIVSLPSMDEAS